MRRLLAVALISGLHISGCIGGLLSIPVAAAAQWSSTAEVSSLPMTPAIFLCQEVETEEVAGDESCGDSASCIAQSGRHVFERSALVIALDVVHPVWITPTALEKWTIRSTETRSRSGPLIAALDTPLHAFVQRE